MSCLGPYYSPNPPREWSRVQNYCSLVYDNPPSTVKLPLIEITVTYQASLYYADLIRKGNVLQYKNNSSNLTKSQRYSKIAQGKWTNRNTTWATQSVEYTNPNIKSLKRVGNINITTAGTETTLPVTCPTLPSINDPFLPSNISGSGINPVIPPPPPPPPVSTGNSGIVPSVANDIPSTPDVIPDLGNLICNTQENICTGETITQPANKFFHPTTDSDVPGTIKELYWNNIIQTWYPKQRLTMNNSSNKWPYNSKFILPGNGFNP
jgi:hypothetical protein